MFQRGLSRVQDRLAEGFAEAAFSSDDAGMT